MSTTGSGENTGVLALTKVYDPLDCLNRKLTLEEIEDEIKVKIAEELNLIKSNDSLGVDTKWYYLAPLLLDSIPSSNFTNNWFNGITDLIYARR